MGALTCAREMAHSFLVAIDTTERPDIEALFASYTPQTLGDVAIQWGQRDGAPTGTLVTLPLSVIS